MAVQAQADVDALPPALGQASQGQATAETERLREVARQAEEEVRRATMCLIAVSFGPSPVHIALLPGVALCSARCCLT